MDLSGYFDIILHAELMKSVYRRISDGRVLRLIKMWLEAPVAETDGKATRHRTTENKDLRIGSPQGAPISRLLSKIYMRRFGKGWKTGGPEKRLEARIVNHADDFVICCRGTAYEAIDPFSLALIRGRCFFSRHCFRSSVTILSQVLESVVIERL